MPTKNDVKDDVRALAVTKRELVMVFNAGGDAKLTLRLSAPKNNLTRDDVEPVMQSAIDRQLFETSGGVAIDEIDTCYLQEVQQDRYI